MTLESAIELACRLHSGQRDKGGETIIYHVLRVMEAMPKRREYQYTALMHDAVEDGLIVIEEVERLFGRDVADQVGGVSRKDGEGYMDYIQRVAPLHIARAVKIADLTDNISPSRRGAISDSQRERYQKALDYLLDYAEQEV